MTILVTGASGILGRPLLAQLLASGEQIIGLCRNPPAPTTKQLRWLRGDVAKPHLGLAGDVWQQLTGDLSQIFHLAARTDFKGKTLDEYTAINVAGVRHIKELALASGAWLHHVSTAFVCGDWQGEFREDQLQENQTFHNYYEESKYLGECALREEPTPPFTVYRPAIILERKPTTASQSVFGPFVFLDGVFRICLGMVKHGNELATLRVDGDRTGHLPFVFDDEVSRCLAKLAEDRSRTGQTYHLTPSTPFANILLEKIFNEAFGRPAVRMEKNGLQQGDPATTPERILAKKTKLYLPYMALTTTFARHNTDAKQPTAMGTIAENELLTAFSLFLATKKDVHRVVNLAETVQLDRYFTHFLEQYTGKPLIKNLSSLSACLHIKITDHKTWTITIEKGVLATIKEGEHGQFGFATSGKTFLQIAAGKISPQQGFFKGDIQLLTNPKEALRTATALEEFFREYPYRDQLEPLD
jgi:nucleoside-diphosphate-sugar epimerase